MWEDSIVEKKKGLYSRGNSHSKQIRLKEERLNL